MTSSPFDPADLSKISGLESLQIEAKRCQIAGDSVGCFFAGTTAFRCELTSMHDRFQKRSSGQNDAFCPIKRIACDLDSADTTVFHRRLYYGATQ